MTVEERVAFERYMMRVAKKSDSNDQLRPRLRRQDSSLVLLL